MLIVSASILYLLFWFMTLPIVPFLFKFFRVKLGGGGVILIKWRSKTGDYYKTARILKLRVIGKKRHEKVKTEITIPAGKNVFYRVWGVYCLDVDEQTNGICTVDYSAIEGFDEETYENLIIRAIMSARNQQVILILIGLGIILLVVLIIAFMLYTHNKNMPLQNAQMVKAIGDICTGKIIK
jgi:hypothetical protein